MKDRVIDESRKRDPRELYLSVDEETKKDPKIFGKAYSNNQPQVQLHNLTFEEEQDAFKKKQKSFN